MYSTLLLGGLIASAIFYKTILFHKGPTKSKLFWTFIIILSVTVQWATEPVLIKGSFLIYLRSNRTELTEVNNILLNRPGEISISDYSINDTKGTLTISEKDNLQKLQKKLGVYVISKSDNGIYYGLWGMLDERIKIIYWTGNEIPDSTYHILKEQWYH
jgi:hypothetical protein